MHASVAYSPIPCYIRRLCVAYSPMLYAATMPRTICHKYAYAVICRHTGRISDALCVRCLKEWWYQSSPQLHTWHVREGTFHGCDFVCTNKIIMFPGECIPTHENCSIQFPI
jgi:hypothetical protein